MLNRPSPPPPWADRPEFSVYLAIKFYLYRQYSERGAAPNGTRVTARRVLALLTGPSGDALNPDRLFTDLDATSGRFIRERLRALNSGTALRRTGRGLRNAVTYEWNENITPGAIQSFQSLAALVGSNVQYAFDAYRILEAFGGQPFRSDDFVRIFAQQRAQSLSRPGRAKPASAAVTNLLMRRLKALAAWGLIQSVGGEYRLTPSGDLAAHWLELFAYSVDYHPREPGAGSSTK